MQNLVLDEKKMFGILKTLIIIIYCYQTLSKGSHDNFLYSRL